MRRAIWQVSAWCVLFWGMAGLASGQSESPRSAKGASAAASQDISWRYRWHDGRWWYWLPNRQWVWWDGSKWSDRVAPAANAGSGYYSGRARSDQSDLIWVRPDVDVYPNRD
jgi:hypothetical protein